jgi:hypothetical protein
MKYIVTLFLCIGIGCGPRAPIVREEPDCSNVPPQTMSDFVTKCSVDVLSKRSVGSYYAVVKCKELAELTMCSKRQYVLDDNDNKIYK